MDYKDIEEVYEFHRNMRRTPWTQLFPHWWDETDALLNAIGDEVERIKALAVFALLNIGIKPPVLLWQESIKHDKYNVNKNLTQLPNNIKIQAPLYKTWGKITLINNTPTPLDGLQIMLDSVNGYVINQLLKQGDKIVIDLVNQKVVLNGDVIRAQEVGDGMPYFITSQNNIEYKDNTPLHNEVVNIQVETTDGRSVKCDIDVDVQMNDAVFTNEQNIEVTALEAVPIDKIELYAFYDFEFNEEYSGWHKVYEKKYDKNTNVIYDMITTQFYTKEFYVDVWFKTLQYPYKVAFPCYQDADEDSMYHVNNRLDTWGVPLGLERRLYRKDIPEDEYARTFPIYYPFDIEQDYWYWKRLISEYSWNDLAVNDADIKDIEGNNVIRLHAIHPFSDDFAVHARSMYSTSREYKNRDRWIPVVVSQKSTKAVYKQSPYSNIINLLEDNERYASIDLTARSGINIGKMKYQSKELWNFFDLSRLPEDINIDDIRIYIEAESLDNKTDKYSTAQTGLIAPGLIDGEEFIPLYADKNYELSEQTITYSNKDLSKYLKKIQPDVDEFITQEMTVGNFEGNLGEAINIPLLLKENDIIVEDITEMYVYFNGKLIKSANKAYPDDDTKDDVYNNVTKSISVDLPRTMIKTLTFVCKCKEHKPFIGTVDVHTKFIYKKDENDEFILTDDGKKIIDDICIYGPFADEESNSTDEPNPIIITEDWHTKDVRNILQKQGLYFRNIFENNNEQSGTSINVKNIILEVEYSEKKTDFTLETKIIKDNLTEPYIAQYEVTITNTGEKPLIADIDIITAPNLQLDRNSIHVELEVNEPYTERIGIMTQYPIVDGTYEIVTFCEDKIKTNFLELSSDGLIETSIQLKPHSGKYNEPITIEADIITADGKLISSIDGIEVYINNYLISPDNNVSLTIHNNHITLTGFIPQRYNFVDTGMLPLDVKFLGDSKYASSHKRNSIFIGKDSTRMEIDAATVAKYESEYQVKIKVQYYDNNNNLQNVTDGNVMVYIDDAMIGEAIRGNDGIFTLTVNKLEEQPGNHILIAEYVNSDQYGNASASQELIIIGGEISVEVFNIEAHPCDTITFTAVAQDSKKHTVTSGYIDFIVEEFNIEITDVPIVNGIAQADYLLDITIKDNASIITPIKARYHDGDYISNDGTANLSVSKYDVDIICSNQFLGSQYEPLGFYLQVVNRETGEKVTDGKVKIDIIGQSGITGEANVDEDGGCRLICNPISSVRLWDRLGRYNFVIEDGSDPYITRDGQRVNLREELLSEDPTFFDDAISGDLYFIYQNEDDKHTQDNENDIVFKINENGILSFYNDEHNVVEDYLFINDDGHLYRRTSTNNRYYQLGTYDVRFTYQGSKRYKKQGKYIEQALTIDTHDVNLDVHSYELQYGSKKNVICFTTDYFNDDLEINGKVKFYLDEEYFTTSDIIDNRAIIDYALYNKISYGNHLLEGRYVNNNLDTTHTYTTFLLSKIDPTMSVHVVPKIKGTISNVTVDIGIPEDLDGIQISGLVTLYLDGEKIDAVYLYGNEEYEGIVNDGDLDDNVRHLNTIDGYNGIHFEVMMPDDIDINEHTLTVEYEGNSVINQKIVNEPLKQEPYEITLYSRPTHIAKGEECSIPIYIDIDEHHTVNEGYIQVLVDNDVIGSFPVHDNKATVSWTPQDNTVYSVTYVYDNDDDRSNDMYTCSIQYPLEDLGIILINSQNFINYICSTNEYATLEDAIRCLKNNGTLQIEGKCKLEDDFTIKKDITIQGANDSIIYVDEPTNLTIDRNNSVEIDNIIFNNKLQINDNGSLKITHSIINKDVMINSAGNLIINRSFVYCDIYGNKTDIDNNWWGKNQPPYNTNNNIILTLTTNDEPAVITEDIQVVGKLIGKNGREYNIPEADFILTADTGYFSLDNGKLINHTVTTSYFDATEEGYIYITVDNETAKCPIYAYDRKTETIIRPVYDVPIGYRATFYADVNRCIDSYYEETDIPGYIDFYIDDNQVGHCVINQGIASVGVYFKEGLNVYSLGEHTLKAVYRPDEYYFKSEDEIKFNIIADNNIVFVSPDSGNDYNNGKFDEPFKTIAHAVTQAPNNGTIYLMNGEYNETNVRIGKNLTIKSYAENVTMENLTGEYIFDCSNGSTDRNINIIGINFINNQVNNLLTQATRTTISHSIIINNKGIFDDGRGNIRYSVILNQTVTGLEDFMKYCWFGTNTPRISIKPSINDYVIMDTASSKDVLYKGIVATVSGRIIKYRHHAGNAYSDYRLEDKLPLRIAQFYSDYASLLPAQDYTYRNQATSLLNTNEETNSKDIVLRVLDKKYYVDNSIAIRCSVQDKVGNKISDGVLNYLLTDKNGVTIADTDKDVKDGYAVFITSELPIGNYALKCTYGNTSYYDYIQIKKKDIVVDNVYITAGDHAHTLSFVADFVDNNGNIIDDENVFVYVDNMNIGQYTITNGQLQQVIDYTMLKAGTHILKFTNENITSEYDVFEHSTSFVSEAKDTYIDFDYSGIELKVPSDLSIIVYDDEKIVDRGNITIILDNEIAYEDVNLDNGGFTIEDLTFEEKGQHYIFIEYDGVDGYYNSSVKAVQINVGIYEVHFVDAPDIMYTGINKSVKINTQIKDISNQIVSRGYVNAYIDEILVNENVNVEIGRLILEAKVPMGIMPGKHKLLLEYIDPTETYANTDKIIELNINYIDTDIVLENTTGYPDQDLNIRYNITSQYGNVDTGKITIKFDDEFGNEKVYSKAVSDNLFNDITIHVPNLPADDYPLKVYYTDASGMYADSQISTQLNISKNQVNIAPRYNNYFADETFLYEATITNKDDKIVKTGKADIYIDNVREIEDVDIINGQMLTELLFTEARTYPLSVVVKEDDYHLETVYRQDFIVNNIIIEDIDVNIENNILTDIIFTTINDHNVTDGIIDIAIDNNQIGSYYVAESNKFVDIDLSSLTKGTHTIRIKYYGSNIFADKNKKIEINIEPKTLEYIHIDDVSGTPKSSINIATTLSENITGTIKYYIDDDYIGLAQVNDNNEVTFDYYIPTTLINDTYTLKAKFIGNNYYDEIEDTATLTITKNETIFSINDVDAYYQSTININVNEGDIDNNALLHFYIKQDDNPRQYIGELIYSIYNDTFTYTLADEFVAGDYTLIAEYDGSPVYSEYIATSELHINTFTPIIDIPNNIDVYIGGQLIIDNIILNSQGTPINVGTITCTQGNDTWFTIDAGKREQYQMPTNITSSQEVTIKYECNTDGKYEDVEKTITLNMLKNNINADIELPEYIYYDVEFEIHLTATSDTTVIPINTTASCSYSADATLSDGKATFNVTISQDDDHTITIKTPKGANHSVFNQTTITKEVQIKLHDIVTLNTNKAESATNAHTLSDAVDLVSERGNVIIETSVANQEATIDKNIVIDGLNNTLTDCSINNNANLSIINTNFNDDTNIVNNNKIDIKNCTFDNSTTTPIQTLGEANIDNCTFSNNNLSATNTGCINIGNRNNHVTITNCHFNNNNSQLNSSCIFSNKGNEVDIVNNEFINNNCNGTPSTCIYVRGNVSIYNNIFYNNNDTQEVYLLDGHLNLHHNIFDGKNKCVAFNNGNGDLDYNYWGINPTARSDIDIDENIEINNWLISHFDVDRKYQNEYYIKAVINQYVNTLEREITTIDNIDYKFPVTINGQDKTNNEYYYLNEEYIVTEGNNNKIGQEVFTWQSIK